MRPTKYDYDRYLKLVQLGVSVSWDHEALKINPFRVADPTMTFTLLRANRDLRDMGKVFGEDISVIDNWITLWSRAQQLCGMKIFKAMIAVMRLQGNLMVSYRMPLHFAGTRV